MLFLLYVNYVSIKQGGGGQGGECFFFSSRSLLLLQHYQPQSIHPNVIHSPGHIQGCPSLENANLIVEMCSTVSLSMEDF